MKNNEKTKVDLSGTRRFSASASLVTDSLALADDSDRSPVDRETANLSPEHLVAGRYRILSKLGEGGFGVVYLAEDEKLNRQVAMKCHLRLRGRSAASLYHEAQIIASLRHHGIVAVHDLIEDDAVGLAIIMEHVEGSDLRQLLSHTKLTVLQSTRLVREIADALAYAHRKQLIHRDLKPSNVLLDADNAPRLSDFGLAINVDAGDENGVAGTLRYMAPEQLLGESHRIDARTDLWGLGVIFYELLAGRLPFNGEDSQEIYHNTLWVDPIPPGRLNSAVPEGLERICLKCLRKRMVDRYQSVIQLIEDLDEWFVDATEEHAEDEQTAPIAIGRSQTHGSSDSTLRLAAPLRFTPKGLKPYDESDAAVFGQLVPGPRHHKGLPEQVLFWKHWVERSHDDPADCIGVLYGPSGTGKTSFIRAGLTPAIDADIKTIYINCQGTDLIAALRDRLATLLPNIDTEASLRQQLNELREHGLIGSGFRKFVFIFDQFEAWLSDTDAETRQAFAESIRQCDGLHMQCLLVARDEYWRRVSEFMQWVETPLIEDYNSQPIRLIDVPHAMRILEGIGRAYGRLPAWPEPPSDSQRRFVASAVEELAEDDMVVSVHLALFGEMVRDREWHAKQLKHEGSISDLAYQYLHRHFDGPSAVAPQRQLRKAVVNALAMMLPSLDHRVDEAGVSREELQKHLAEQGQADQLDDVIDVLSDQLRWITTSHGEEEGDGDGRIHYQLAHELLVRPTREWVETAKKSTWQGRTSARLEELSAIWNKYPSRQWYPTLAEYVAMQLGPRRTLRTPVQRRFLRAAGRYHSGKIAITLIALLVAGITTAVATHEHRIAKHAEAGQIVAELDMILHGPFEEYPDRVNKLLARGVDLTEQLAPWKESVERDIRIRARVLASKYRPQPRDDLFVDLGAAPENFYSYYHEALQIVDDRREYLTEIIEKTEDKTTRLRAILLLFEEGDDSYVRELLRFQPDETARRELVEVASTWRGKAEPWVELMTSAQEPDLIYGASLVVGMYDKEVLESLLTEDTLRALYHSPDPQLHSQGNWLLQRLGRTDIGEPAAVPPNAKWTTTPYDFEMIRIDPGNVTLRGSDPRRENWPITIEEPFWLSDIMITRGLFQQYLDEVPLMPSGRENEAMLDSAGISPAEYADENRAASGFTIYAAYHFCNWLSKKSGLEPVYTFIKRDVEEPMKLYRPIEIWEADVSRNGFRLPTTDEFAYVVAANSESGSRWLVNNAIWNAWNPERPRAMMRKRYLPANPFGVFDHEIVGSNYVYSDRDPRLVFTVSVIESAIYDMDFPKASRGFFRGFHVALPEAGTQVMREATLK